jgi:hypothetical protein
MSSYANDMSWPDRIERIERLDCTREEAERLAAHILGSVTLDSTSLVRVVGAQPR